MTIDFTKPFKLKPWRAECITQFHSQIFKQASMGLKAGMKVKAKVIDFKSVGAIVQCPSGVKAVCPLQHMSESDIETSMENFKVGAELDFRVLSRESKRITVTHKKKLVKSKLKILSSYADAVEGLVTHGWIAKIEKHGCFVRFYNGVHGLAPRSELGIESGCNTSFGYHIGQVVKCRVTKSDPATNRIFLSFMIPKHDYDVVKLSSVASGDTEFVMQN